jgi:hypothetical protein
MIKKMIFCLPCSQGNILILTPSSYSFKQIGQVSYLSVFWYFLVGIFLSSDLGKRFFLILWQCNENLTI